MMSTGRGKIKHKGNEALEEYVLKGNRISILEGVCILVYQIHMRQLEGSKQRDLS